MLRLMTVSWWPNTISDHTPLQINMLIVLQATALVVIPQHPLQLLSCWKPLKYLMTKKRPEIEDITYKQDFVVFSIPLPTS